MFVEDHLHTAGWVRNGRGRKREGRERRGEEGRGKGEEEKEEGEVLSVQPCLLTQLASKFHKEKKNLHMHALTL